MFKPLGKITVAVGGVPTRLTVNQADPAARIGAQAIMIQVLPGNTGLVYVRTGTGTGDDRTTLARTVAILPAPASATSGPFSSVTISLPVVAAGLDVSSFWIDVSVNTNGVIASYTQG